MWFYYLIFSCLTFLTFKKIQQQNLIVIFILMILISVAGLRGPVDNDYKQYVDYYEQSCSGIIPAEFSFYLFSNIINILFSNIQVLFIFYAIIGVSVKLYAIKKLTELWIFSILIYFSYFFILHEMTQIRIGVAVGFILLSIKYIEEKNIKYYVITLLAAVFFHYSALIMLPLYFLHKDRINKIFYFLIPIAYLLYFLDFNIVKVIGYLDFTKKYDFYKSLAPNNHINVFGYWQLLRCLFCGVLLWKLPLLLSNNKYAAILTKFYILSCFFLVVFASIPSIASRISEMFASVECILLPFLIYLLKNKKVGMIAVYFIAIVMLSMSLYYSCLLKNYF